MRELESIGKSLVISINNLSLIGDNDRVIWMENGKISYDGSWSGCQLYDKDLGFNVEIEKTDSPLENNEVMANENDQTQGKEKNLPVEEADNSSELQFFVEEGRVEGGLKCTVVNRMVNALGGWIIATLIILMTLVTFVILLFFTLYSVNWAEDFKDGKDTTTLER